MSNVSMPELLGKMDRHGLVNADRSEQLVQRGFGRANAHHSNLSMLLASQFANLLWDESASCCSKSCIR
ncbi:B3 domain-containing protein [Trichinella pseudospiralis]